MYKKAFFNWSSGKDSALALYKMQKNNEYSVEHLLTSINEAHDRVTMHGLRKSLLLKQIETLNIPHSFLKLSSKPDNDEYEKRMFSKISALKADGFEYAGFGDIFLEDLKEYRENQLTELGVEAVFPLWLQDTKKVIEEFTELGFKAVVVCVEGKKLDKSFLGRKLDKSFFNDLPSEVDMCGENGEFHTFCYDGPIFKEPVSFRKGEIITRSYPSEVEHNFHFLDLIET